MSRRLAVFTVVTLIFFGVAGCSARVPTPSFSDLRGHWVGAGGTYLDIDGDGVISAGRVPLYVSTAPALSKKVVEVSGSVMLVGAKHAYRGSRLPVVIVTFEGDSFKAISQQPRYDSANGGELSFDVGPVEHSSQWKMTRDE